MPTATIHDTSMMIQALEAGFERNGNAGNAAALCADFYTEDASLLPPNAPLVRGAAAIREFWTAFLATGVTDIQLRTADVVASGDLAYSLGNYEFTQGGIRHLGKYMVVYRRDAAGGYKAVADSFSDNA